MPGCRYPVAYRPSILHIIISLSLGFMVFLIFRINMPRLSGEGYAVLAFDKNLEDRRIGELLKASGFNDFFSESSAMVYFDDFGYQKGFFLDQYDEEIASFDPRNDGYAQKLQSFFVNRGNRYFFIPLEDTGRQDLIRKKFALALGDIPYELDILGISGSIFWYFIFQFIAVSIVFLISRDKWRYALQIPVLLCFSWLGISGIMLSAILTGIWELLRDPLEELFSSRPFGNTRERFWRFHIHFFWCILFFVFFCILSFGLPIGTQKPGTGALFRTGNIPALPLWSGFFCFFCIEIISFLIKGSKLHRRGFTPVMILLFPAKTRVFRKPVSIFACTALVALGLLRILPGFSFKQAENYTEKYPNIPGQKEYEAHMAFQSAFSMMPLGDNLGDTEYLHYYLGNDGLIAGTMDSFKASAWDIPEFPLEKLSDFLLNYGNRAGDTPLPLLKDWFLLALILLCCIPVRSNTEKSINKKKKNPLIRDRRIAA